MYPSNLQITTRLGDLVERTLSESCLGEICSRRGKECRRGRCLAAGNLLRSQIRACRRRVNPFEGEGSLGEGITKVKIGDRTGPGRISNGRMHEFRGSVEAVGFGSSQGREGY
jgi:hypothetical protein